MRMRTLALALAVSLAGGLPGAAEIVDRIAATVEDRAIPESELREAMVVSALFSGAGESPEAFGSWSSTR